MKVAIIMFLYKCSKHKWMNFIIVLCCMFLIGCGSENTNVNDKTSITGDVLSTEPSQDNTTSSTAEAISAGARDNTPICLVPEAPGAETFANELACIDYSNASEGYVMVKYTGSCSKVKLQITGPNGVTYTYNLLGADFESFPLSSESGSYKISIYENVSGDQYSTALSEDIIVEISNTFGPYLYPNQYVKFQSTSNVVAMAKELAEPANGDLEVVDSIYNFVVSSISYDDEKAQNVPSGYVSNVDAILEGKTGICLDYAAVMASMLRSQGIPTRLEVGYAKTAYHAWISTYIEEIGWVSGIIEFNGKDWTLMDPTYAANSSKSSLKDFIGDGNNYSTKYIY